jgi:hypothetical protein
MDQDSSLYDGLISASACPMIMVIKAFTALVAMTSVSCSELLTYAPLQEFLDFPPYTQGGEFVKRETSFKFRKVRKANMSAPEITGLECDNVLSPYFYSLVYFI